MTAAPAAAQALPRATAGAYLDAVGRARALGPLIAASADTVEKTRRIPEPLLTELHTSRLLRLSLPRAFGGPHAISVRGLVKIARAISFCCPVSVAGTEPIQSWAARIDIFTTWPT